MICYSWLSKTITIYDIELFFSICFFRCVKCKIIDLAIDMPVIRVNRHNCASLLALIIKKNLIIILKKTEWIFMSWYVFLLRKDPIWPHTVIFKIALVWPFPKLSPNKRYWNYFFVLGHQFMIIFKYGANLILYHVHYMYVIDMSPPICSLAYVYCLLSVYSLNFSGYRRNGDK